MQMSVDAEVRALRGGGWAMSTVTEGSDRTQMTARSDRAEFEAGSRHRFLTMPELWAAISIAFMWLAVLFDGIYGDDFVSVNSAGTQTTTIPSAVFVALFAALATGSVAKRAFRRDVG
jgi:hypothetical protein